MGFLHQFIEGFSRWIDCVADTVVAVRGWFAPSPKVELIEEAGGTFAVQTTGRDAAARSAADRVQIVDGKVVGVLPPALQARLKASRTELVLQADRFVFRPLELPRRAGEFLGGIVRAQIDRLTPWRVGDAVFGWSPPSEIANDRMVVTVVATARAAVAPLVEAVMGLGVDSVVVSTRLQGYGPDAAAVKVFEQKGGSLLEVHRVRRALLTTLLVAGLFASAATIAEVIVGNDLEARQIDITQRISARRALMHASLDASGDSALAALERRKHETPSSVIVLEALSQVLPDHTYVTELRIEGDKMQVVGITRDAPSLIRLIEQSPHFTRATFFAPTTRSPSESGEHFHIEARIEPVNEPRT